MTGGVPTIGIIANPVSARDIRRVVANASHLQLSDRVNMVLRVLLAAAATGVERALMMPDREGLCAMLARALERERTLGRRLPDVRFLDMPPSSTVEDTFASARAMREARVRSIVVLGGDGTHRAVARECGAVPIAGLSTGTNNAFPEMREPTIAGMAVGLHATGRLSDEDALVPNKVLRVSIDDGQRSDIALVDVAISAERGVGARALWRVEPLRAVYVTFADPEAIGMSAIAGLLQPLGRRDRGGLAVAIGEARESPALTLRVPIAPGMVRPIAIAGWQAMPPGEPFAVARSAGVVALDGERELAFDERERVTVTLCEGAFRTVDVGRCMQLAARRGLLRDAPGAASTAP